jgi:hypothetical protein
MLHVPERVPNYGMDTMANRKRKCRECKNYVFSENCVIVPLGAFCCMDCVVAHGSKTGKVASDKRKKETLTKLRAELKTASEWLAGLQKHVNKYIRLRDAKDGCISCDKPSTWYGQWHASHFYPRGRASAVRFNLWNIHKSCSVCNSHLSGNLIEYRSRLIEKIGRDRFDSIEAIHRDIVSYDIEYIKKGIRVAKKAVKRLEKRI